MSHDYWSQNYYINEYKINIIISIIFNCAVSHMKGFMTVGRVKNGHSCSYVIKDWPLIDTATHLIFCL